MTVAVKYLHNPQITVADINMVVLVNAHTLGAVKLAHVNPPAAYGAHRFALRAVYLNARIDNIDDKDGGVFADSNKKRVVELVAQLAFRAPGGNMLIVAKAVNIYMVVVIIDNIQPLPGFINGDIYGIAGPITLCGAKRKLAYKSTIGRKGLNAVITGIRNIDSPGADGCDAQRGIKLTRTVSLDAK